MSVDSSTTIVLACWLTIATNGFAEEPAAYDAAPPRGASSAAASLVSLSGSWRRQEDSRQRASRHRAIDQATETLGWLKRNAAREKLRALTAANDELRISDAGGSVMLETAERKMSVVVDGAPAEFSSPKMSGTVRAVRNEGKLTVEVASPSGKRTTTYLPSKDGKTMTLDIAMSGARLATPIRYQTTYIRTESLATAGH